MKFSIRSSLRYKQVYILALGLLISFLMYLATQSLGDYLISKNHLNADASTKRLENYQNSIEAYIRKNKLSVKDVRALSKWVKSHKYTYLTIYSGDEILYESGFWNDAYYNYESTGTFLEESQQLTRNHCIYRRGLFCIHYRFLGNQMVQHCFLYIPWSFLFVFVRHCDLL